MRYYLLVTIAVIMFSFQFLFNQRFEKQCGNTLKASLVFSLGTNIAGFISLLIINKFLFEFTWFSLIMSTVVALNGILFIFFSIKAFNKINLSLYSVFSMLGGMTLPFILGVTVYHEKLTPIHLICFVLITTALFFTVKKDDDKKGYIYYIGIFILNGMSGVLSKIFQSADYKKTSPEGFSVLCALMGVLISLILLLFFNKQKVKINIKSASDMTLYGIINKVANLLLLLSLEYLPVSVQYTFITGGVMIISTVIALFSKQKPSKKEIISVIISFFAVLILTLV